MSNRTEISTLGEFGLIRHLTDKIELKNPSTLKVLVTTQPYWITQTSKYWLRQTFCWKVFISI